MPEVLELESPPVGEEVKVFLKGESPWAVVTHSSDEIIKVMFHMKVYGPLHGHKKGDEIWCRRRDFGAWHDVSYADELDALGIYAEGDA